MKKNSLTVSVCSIASIFVGLTVLLSACGTQQSDSQSNTMADKTVTGNGIPDTSLGLSKTSVFDTPETPPTHYNEKFPGSNTVLPRAYPNAPPQIPHNIDSFKPITAKSNACLGCHNNPAMRGKKAAGMPTAMPESHYDDLRNTPGNVGNQIVGARYVCTQCHVPQADTGPMVENTFNSEQQP